MQALSPRYQGVPFGFQTFEDGPEVFTRLVDKHGHLLDRLFQPLDADLAHRRNGVRFHLLTGSQARQPLGGARWRTPMMGLYARCEKSGNGAFHADGYKLQQHSEVIGLWAGFGSPRITRTAALIPYAIECKLSDLLEHVALMVVVLDHANGYLAQAESLSMQPMEQFKILIDMGDEEMKLLAGFNIFDADRARIA